MKDDHAMMTHLLSFVVLYFSLVAPQPVGAVRQASTTAPPRVYVAVVDGIIHPISAEYMIETMKRADENGADLVLFELRTPGGLVESTRAITSAMIAARTPIAVFVAPSGARAASAGFFIVLASDVALMAPGTHIGAAHPVSGSGEKMDDTTSKKAASDVAAYARSLATSRGRNVDLATLAVTESKAFTEKEALSAKPPLIDLIVPTVNGALEQLDGRSIRRFHGEEVTLRTRGATIVRIEMTWRQQILSAIAHPVVAYLLFSLGMLGLTIELWNPGSILPGIVGGLCLLLAFFAFDVLPVNYAGVLLMLFGMALLILEVKVASFGLLTIGGLTSLVLGSMMLIDAPTPELQVGLRIIAPVTAALGGIVIFLVRLGIAAQRRRSITGHEGMVDQVGRVVSAISAHGQGQVFVRGEYWSATTDRDVPVGTQVVVTGVNGLTLHVRPSSAFSSEKPTAV